MLGYNRIYFKNKQVHHRGANPPVVHLFRISVPTHPHLSAGLRNCNEVP